MHGHQRSERMAAQLQRLLAVLIRDEVRDPRAAGATVTTTQVSRDLSRAKVYILAEDPESSKRAAEALNGAAGFLRSKVAAEIISRSVPQLKFLYDETIDEANRMEALISVVRAKDEASRPVDDEPGPADDQAEGQPESGPDPDTNPNSNPNPNPNPGTDQSE